ncbi:unnamed protein product [Amoebophrya sp. A120]|nr:unnamed protein product [Amoebophrya sp. A120]|eukprot:GSA120T00005879001.1
MIGYVRMRRADDAVVEAQQQQPGARMGRNGGARRKDVAV